tara:strand:+ start:951 stop:1619 length:669 start_codon:yes stop_codon:yes gene_type:complete
MNLPLAVYVGAGLDLKIIKNIPEVKNFVFIDSLPNSKFGIDENWTRDSSYIFSCICPGWAPFINTYSRPNFISDLKKTAIKEDFKLVSEEVNKNLKFEYKDQTINYFINTSIPHHLPLIKNNIKNFDHLIITRFFPHHTILNYTTKNITFWGNTNTIYNNIQNNCLYNNQENKDTVIYKLNNESLYEKKFKKFNVIQNNNITCFRFWENFIIYTQYISNNKE